MIRDRFKLVLSNYGVALSSIAIDPAMQTRLSRQVNAGAAITYDTLSRLLDVFPDVSAEWLLRGKGKMLLSENLPDFHGSETDSEENLKIELSKVLAELDEYKKMILRLEAQKDYLQERNDNLVISNRMLQDELNKYQEPKKKKDII